MRTENYREQYQPPCIELIPWADPYIANLVARASWPTKQQSGGLREQSAEAAPPPTEYPGSELERGTFRRGAVGSRMSTKVRAGWQ